MAFVDTPADAMCGKHPGVPAVITCERCGDFCCDACRVTTTALCHECAALPSAASPELVNPFRRLWQLPLQPERFFAPNLRFLRFATLVAAYLVGVAGSIERRGESLLRQELSSSLGSGPAADPVFVSWTGLWIGALLAGTLSGVLYYYVGGFWYGLRLRWSGVSDADPRGVRELNTYTDLILEIPYVLVTLVETFVYASFDEAWVQGPLYENYLYEALGLAAVITSYRGVVARYGVRSVWGVFWFLALPGIRCIAGMLLVHLVQTEGWEGVLRHFTGML